jgi:hypothetical protein
VSVVVGWLEVRGSVGALLGSPSPTARLEVDIRTAGASEAII